MNATATPELMKQIANQCRVVAHLADALSGIHHDYERMYLGEVSEGAKDIADIVGKRTAQIMETLGDILNGMDAVTEEDDWTHPIFREANRLWLAPAA
ncbi:hypothetical protein EJ076_34955 [Mesorhizobium sp. M7D.F.Ca.US.005.01.1.1]|uniref:hypothetical protein n=1 Tax=Mesorhizobium sp. M7D.F.Ca.US.005.01.1.1 TaxID=2493678 RepID=UPI000F7563E4|nr:hypothetical protein [Mesorhizobium sp. M7D.F.Ca.US.005.01.1.1]AZO45916.1 hypothetical protein EJ076_34955 [Mesorhizobium sp. M7D.F.Ca.US.005.01.1.1]